MSVGRKITMITLGLCVTLATTLAWVYQPHNVEPLTVSGYKSFIQADSNVKLGTQVFVSNLAVGDTLVYKYFVNDTQAVVHRTVVNRDSTIVKAPNYGATSTYKGTVQIERGGRTSGVKYPAAPLGWGWIYTRPLPVPTIDSIVRITLRPGTSQLTARDGTAIRPVNKQQMCTFGVTKSGKKVKLHNSWNVKDCEVPFQSFLNERDA